MLLYEKYRPTTRADVVGQDAALRKLDRIAASEGMAGQVLWLIGKSGTGKTTIARIIAEEHCDPAYVVEVNAADLTVQDIRDWEERARYSPIGCRLWAFTINETHLLRNAIVSRLLTTVETAAWQRNCLLIGTTTPAGGSLFDESFDAAPFGSRTKEIRLSGEVCQAFAERAQQIATAENLNGKPIEAYVKLMRKCSNNLRDAINRIAAGEMLD